MIITSIVQWLYSEQDNLRLEPPIDDADERRETFLRRARARYIRDVSYLRRQLELVEHQSDVDAKVPPSALADLNSPRYPRESDYEATQQPARKKVKLDPVQELWEAIRHRELEPLYVMD